VVSAAAGILDTIVVTQYSMSRTFVMLGRMGLVPPLLVRATTAAKLEHMSDISTYICKQQQQQRRAGKI
jgi:hypothetical protein